MGEEVRNDQTGRLSTSAHLRTALDEYLAARFTRQSEHMKHGRLLLAAVQMKVELELRKDALADLEKTAGEVLAGYDLDELPDDPQLVVELEQATCLMDEAFAARIATRDEVIAIFTGLRRSALRATGKKTTRDSSVQGSEARKRALSALMSAMTFQSMGPSEASDSDMTEILHEMVRLVHEDDGTLYPEIGSFEETFDTTSINEMENGRPSWLRLQWFEATKLVRQLLAESKDSRALQVEMRTELGGALLEAAGRGDDLVGMKPKQAMAIASHIGQDIETAILDSHLGRDLPLVTWALAVNVARNLFDLQQAADSEWGMNGLTDL